MTKRTATFAHLAALILLAIWGILEVGGAGTLTFTFWIAWSLYAALLLLMKKGSKIGEFLVLAPPAIWAAFSGFDIVPQALEYFAGGSLSTPAMMGAVLITLPCIAALAAHLWYAATALKMRRIRM